MGVNSKFSTLKLTTSKFSIYTHLVNSKIYNMTLLTHAYAKPAFDKTDHPYPTVQTLSYVAGDICTLLKLSMSKITQGGVTCFRFV